MKSNVSASSLSTTCLFGNWQFLLSFHLHIKKSQEKIPQPILHFNHLITHPNLQSLSQAISDHGIKGLNLINIYIYIFLLNKYVLPKSLVLACFRCQFSPSPKNRSEETSPRNTKSLSSGANQLTLPLNSP